MIMIIILMILCVKKIMITIKKITTTAAKIMITIKKLTTAAAKIMITIKKLTVIAAKIMIKKMFIIKLIIIKN